MDRRPAGSKKWRTSKWKRLLELVLPALNKLPKELTFAANIKSKRIVISIAKLNGGVKS